MARTVRLTVSPDLADRLIARLGRSPGVLAVRRHSGASVLPPGDVVEFDTTTDGFNLLRTAVSAQGIGHQHGTTLGTAEPASLVVPGASLPLEAERSEASWDEMLVVLVKEGNMTANGMLLMGVSGALAAVGLETEAVHYVIGGMLIAPAVEPIARIPLAAIGGVGRLRHGLGDVAKGYGVMLAAAVVTTALLFGGGGSPAAYYEITNSLISYWSSFTSVSVYSSVLAALAGGILIATRRSVFTTGALVALTLNPSIAAAGVFIGKGELAPAVRPLLRWTTEAAIVLAAAAAVFAWKRATVHRGTSRLHLRRRTRRTPPGE